MNTTLRHILLVLLIGSLLAACSLGGEEPPVEQAAEPTPTGRPVAIEGGVAIPGRLLFVQNGNLYLHENGATQQITRDGLTRDPAWAPDGSKIAYVRREESFSDLYLLDANGGLPTQVTFNRGPSEPWTREFMHQVVWAMSPAWTPDSSEIVFLSQVAPPTEQPAEYPLALYRYSLDLVGQRQPTNDDLLVQQDDADLQRPVWSPDGSQLAFVRVPRDAEPKQIMVYDPNTAQVAPYPGIPANAYDPAWSPDGQWLAFTANVDGQTDVWAIPAPQNGGSPIRLTSDGDARAPAWSPDGSQLAYVKVDATGADLFVMPLQRDGGLLGGGAPTRLTTEGQIDANSGLSWGE